MTNLIGWYVNSLVAPTEGRSIEGLCMQVGHCVLTIPLPERGDFPPSAVSNLFPGYCWRQPRSPLDHCPLLGHRCLDGVPRVFPQLYSNGLLSPNRYVREPYLDREVFWS